MFYSIKPFSIAKTCEKAKTIEIIFAPFCFFAHFRIKNIQKISWDRLTAGGDARVPSRETSVPCYYLHIA